jgi:hypothetical protein
MGSVFDSIAKSRRGFATALLCVITQTAGCGHVPTLPDSMKTRDGKDSSSTVAEPLPNEIVVVVNYNAPLGVHAGMFAGSYMLDPVGGYSPKRSTDRNWRGPTLKDYVRFQMEDNGPIVILYRFAVSPEQFVSIERHARDVVFSFPAFCAADVLNVIAGVSPFDNIPKRWWLSPAALAQELDQLTTGPHPVGICVWPNGTPCSATDKIQTAK